MHTPFKDWLARAAEESQRQRTDRYLRETPLWLRILTPFVFGVGAVVSVAGVAMIEIALVAVVVGMIWWIIGLAFPALPSITVYQCIYIADAIKLVMWLLIPRKK